MIIQITFVSILLIFGSAESVASSNQRQRQQQRQQRDYLDDYLEKLVIQFDQKLDEVGISNLLVNDFTINVNRTVSGVKLLGEVAYSDVIILDVATLMLQTEGHRGQPEDTGIHLFYQINFPNMTMFADVDADIEPLGKEKGTAELMFPNTTISINFDKNYTLGQTNITCQPYATMAPSTNFLPVSDVMDAAGRLARLDLGSQFLWYQLDDWCKDVFLPMLKVIINNIEFPDFPPDSVITRHDTTI